MGQEILYLEDCWRRDVLYASLRRFVRQVRRRAPSEARVVITTLHPGPHSHPLTPVEEQRWPTIS
jgi:hypothetical protein